MSGSNSKYRVESAVAKGIAMEEAKQGKRQTYGRQLEGNMVFRPVAFETFGGWDNNTALICRRIASILARNQGKNESKMTLVEIPNAIRQFGDVVKDR